jgi:FKBP-type peptidyl-prolyl cis-trans isomerase
MLLSYAWAQQTSATTASQPASGQSATAQTPAKTQTGTTAKKTPAAAAKTAPAVTLKTQKDKESYALGMKIGSDLNRQGLGKMVDGSLVARGLKDAMSGSKTALADDEMKNMLKQLQTDLQQKMDAKTHEEAAAGHKEGEAFLAANKTKEGVVTLPSGLQYKILKAGDGPKPTASDTVTCNYRGTFINGTEFDSSYKRGQPASFPVGGVIKGWTEALQLMPVGSKWQLFIPSDLAYGDAGRPGIPPGSTLIFEVELLSIAEQKK